MFNKGEMNLTNMLATYGVLFALTMLAWFIFYPDLHAFLTGNLVKYFSGLSVLVGVFCSACANQIKDVLRVKMYDTEKYNKIYHDYKSQLRDGKESHFYMDKHGPLNHFIDLIRSCGAVMILSPVLLLVLNASGSSILWESIGMLCFVAALHALIVSVYYIYQNIESLRRFTKY